jgi:pilus assembly protein Flp/PilA
MYRLRKLASSLVGEAHRLARDEAGASAIEYAVIATGIAVAIVAAVTSLGTATEGMYANVQSALK